TDSVSLADLMQLFGSAGANLVPVGGNASAFDQLIADCVVSKSDLREQLRIKHPPKSAVGTVVPGHHAIELILNSTFQIAQALATGYDATFDERRMNALDVGKQQRVANVEENNFDF